MYKQENKAGFIQYIISLLAGILIWILCDAIGMVVKNALISDIIFIVIGAIFVYFIYVHYCAVFLYETDEDKLKITRILGHKKVTEEIHFEKINKMYLEKPEKLPKNTVYYTVKTFMRKNFCYIVYDKNEKCVVIEPDNEFIEILKEKINDWNSWS